MASRLGGIAFCAVLVVGACEDASSFMTFRVDSPSFEPEGYAGVRIDLQTGNGRVTLTGDSFSELSGVALSEVLEVPNSGEAVIGIELSEGGETIADGDLTIELRDATRWGVHLFRGADDPSEGCIGCEGVARFAISSVRQREPGDSIWVTWGGLREGEVAVTDTLEHSRLSSYVLNSAAAVM
ncbi:MAG TPA: hypothetical protein VFH82_03780 [Gemmatimonadota bacterium]|jgi:hypothetical protein|nr:hypothetical protein [Gemmatimonadota bacterium]